MSKTETVSGGVFDGFEVISTYTRKQAIEDGFLADLSALFPDLVREAGFKAHTACTDALWGLIDAMPMPEGNDHKGRLWDVLFMAMRALKGAYVARQGDVGSRVPFRVILAPDEVELAIVLSHGDRGEPTITIMLADED